MMFRKTCTPCYWYVRQYINEDGVGVVELCTCPQRTGEPIRKDCERFVTVRDMALKFPRQWMEPGRK